MNVLLIDDDYDLYSLLNEYLLQQGITCSHAPDPPKGLDMLVRGTFDAAILDVMLPGMNGFEFLRRLRGDEKHATLPVIMLTARGRETDKVIGLEMGADDYLGKPFSPRELVARLRALYRRTRTFPAVQQVGDIAINRPQLTVTVNGQVQQLSMQEMRILNLLVDNLGRTVSRNVLYTSTHQRSLSLADRSLDMLVSRLRKKLGSRSDGGNRIQAVRGQGYVLLAQEK
jgi:DNA-binding response OmpR family regulator